MCIRFFMFIFHIILMFVYYYPHVIWWTTLFMLLTAVKSPCICLFSMYLFMLTIQFLAHALSSTSFCRPAILFYQFPWRYACVYVCLCMWVSEWGLTVKERGCVISTLWALCVFADCMCLQGSQVSLWHSAASLHPVWSNLFFLYFAPCLCWMQLDFMWSSLSWEILKPE